MIDRAIWALWYELSDEDRAPYLDWFHGVHIPEKLARPGYVWAAHYRLVDGGARYQDAIAGRQYGQAPGLGRGRGYLALFGGADVRAFLAPSPAELKTRQDDLTRRWVGARRETCAAVFAEEVRVDGPEALTRAPGVTPAPVIRLDWLDPQNVAASDELGAFTVQQRLPALQGMAGCVGARTLLASIGWGRHGMLIEFVSQAAFEARFVAHEAALHGPDSRGARLLARLRFAPCSAVIGERIWPPLPAT